MTEQDGQIIAFPPRRRGSVQWEPWVSDIIVARYFSVSTRTIRRWRTKGMPSKMLGSSRRYKLSEVERWHTEDIIMKTPHASPEEDRRTRG